MHGCFLPGNVACPCTCAHTRARGCGGRPCRRGSGGCLHRGVQRWACTPAHCVHEAPQLLPRWCAAPGQACPQECTAHALPVGTQELGRCQAALHTRKRSGCMVRAVSCAAQVPGESQKMTRGGTRRRQRPQARAGALPRAGAGLRHLLPFGQAQRRPHCTRRATQGPFLLADRDSRHMHGLCTHAFTPIPYMKGSHLPQKCPAHRRGCPSPGRSWAAKGSACCCTHGPPATLLPGPHCHPPL